MGAHGARTTDLEGVLVGAGFFAGFQAEAWRRIPGVHLAAIADVDVDRARAFAGRWGIPRVYADAAEMLAKERPHFVDIATRPDAHLPLARLAAGHGAHVICQKPLAPTWRDSVALVDACRDAGVRCLVHENWRFQPWYRACRRVLDDGALGRLFYAGFRMRTGDGRGPAPYEVQPYFRDMPRLLVYETAIHFLDTFRYLAGPIEEVFCRTRRVNPAIRGEDLAVIHVGFASGATGLIDANRLAGPHPADVAFGTLRLEGEGGVLEVSADGRVTLAGPDGRDPRPVSVEARGDGYRGDSVHAVQVHLAEALRAGRVAEVEGDAYLDTTAAVFACYRSAATGRAVRVADVRTGRERVDEDADQSHREESAR
jgi:predicted dehydrogenase